ncbi:MAG: hypothetical protein ACR2Q3_01595 [Woeseiaceae bacterium]
MTETAADTRALIVDAPLSTIVYLGAGIEIYAVKSHDPMLSLDQHGRRTVMRCVAGDVASVAVGSQVTIKGTDATYRVAEKIPHHLTTQLVLEVVA